MAKGFSLPFIADVSAFLKGTKNMADSLEDVADSLDDLGRNDKATDKLEDSFKSAGKEAGKMEDKASAAFKGIAADARNTGRKVGSDVKDGTDKAAAGMDDLKSESASTAKETAASFSSIEDAGGALQEVLANAFVGFGPAGMAAGLLAAAGVGLLISSATESADQINEAKENMLSLAQTIKDNGGTLSDADYVANMEAFGYAIQDSKEWFEVFQEDALSGFDQMRKYAKDTGLSVRDIFKGGFGDRREAEATLELVQAKLETLREKKESLYNTTGSILDPVDGEALDSLEKSEELIEKNIAAQKDAEATERLRKKSIEGTTEARAEDTRAAEAAAEAEQEQAQYIDGTTEALARNMRQLEQRSDAMKGSVSSGLDYLDGIAKLNDALKTNGLTVDESTQKGRDNQRAILDQASAIEKVATDSLTAGENVDVVTSKFQSQKDALINQVTPAFGGSKEAARQYIEQVLKTPQTAATKVELKGQEIVQTQLRELAKPITIPLRPDYSPTYFQGILNQMSNRSVSVNVVPRSGTPLAP